METKLFNPLFEGDVKNEFWELSYGILLNFFDNKPRKLDNNIVSSMLINIFSHWPFQKKLSP